MAEEDIDCRPPRRLHLRVRRRRRRRPGRHDPRHFAARVLTLTLSAPALPTRPTRTSRRPGCSPGWSPGTTTRSTTTTRASTPSSRTRARVPRAPRAPTRPTSSTCRCRSARPKRMGQLYRRLYGDIAEFNLLDTRQYRTDNPCGDGEQPPCDAGFDPAATMTGPPRSVAARRAGARAPWNVIAQGVLMGQLKHDADGGRFWNDSWDGWPGQRSGSCSASPTPAPEPGRDHRRLALDVRQRPQGGLRRRDAPVVATEFVGTSISSNGDCRCTAPTTGR